MKPHIGLASAIIILTCGCTTEQGAPTAPAAGDASIGSTTEATRAERRTTANDGFFPLEIGNRWEYDYVGKTQFIPPGESEPETIKTFKIRTEFEVTCFTTVNGRSYTVVRESHKSGERIIWAHYRQDRSGLYRLLVKGLTSPCEETPGPDIGRDAELPSASEIEWDGSLNRVRDLATREGIRSVSMALGSPASLLIGGWPIDEVKRTGPPGGAVENEALLLPYPLRLGAQWDDQPPQQRSSVVEGVDVVILPNGERVSAYRIRQAPTDPNENYLGLAWYGRSGFLGSVVSSRSESVLGTFLAEYSYVLTGISLVNGRGAHRDGE